MAHRGEHAHAVVYGLIDPRDDQLRYVGKTEQHLKRRVRAHVDEARSSPRSSPRLVWLREVLATGTTPIPVVLEGAAPDVADEAEQFHISYYRSIGCRLVNGTDGGRGVPGWVPTLEARENMRKAAQRPENVEKLRKMAEGNRGRVASERQREAARRANLGKTVSDETRARMSASRKGRVFTPEWKARLAAAHRRPVRDQNGVVYESVGAAAEALGLNPSGISGVLNGRIKHTGGYTFTRVAEE